MGAEKVYVQVTVRRPSGLEADITRADSFLHSCINTRKDIFNNPFLVFLTVNVMLLQPTFYEIEMNIS